MRKALVVAAVVVAVLFAAPAAHAQYQPGEPGIVVIPSSTTPGTVVAVEGFGCVRNSEVVIRIDDVVVATVIAADDSTGSFTADITAPSAVGVYTVTATCGATVLSTTLTVVPVAVSPSNDDAGTGDLPATGSNATLTLVRAGLALVVVGGFVVLAVRQRRTRV